MEKIIDDLKSEGLLKKKKNVARTPICEEARLL
jgi:hypothetical protein